MIKIYTLASRRRKKCNCEQNCSVALKEIYALTNGSRLRLPSSSLLHDVPNNISRHQLLLPPKIFIAGLGFIPSCKSRGEWSRTARARRLQRRDTHADPVLLTVSSLQRPSLPTYRPTTVIPDCRHVLTSEDEGRDNERKAGTLHDCKHTHTSALDS